MLQTLDLVIFILTYIGLALGGIPGTKADRMVVAVLGAIGMLLCAHLTIDEAVGLINFPTLILLASLMMLSGQLRLAGFYEEIIAMIVRVAHKPWTLLSLLILASGLLSALFSNDIICLTFAPLLCVAMQRARRDPIPYLMALATSSNIGSAATLIGNPQNMLIGQSAGLSFANYTLWCVPLVLVCLLVNLLMIFAIYRRRLLAAPRAESTGEELPAKRSYDAGLIRKTLLITGALLVTFLLGGSRELASLVAAGLILLSRKSRPRELLEQIDWHLILLFIGLFVVIGQVQRHGYLEGIPAMLSAHGLVLTRSGPLAITTLVLSNLVSNVPAVLLLKPFLAGAAPHSWYLLAMISTLAGNLTLLGSIANLIVAEQARPHGVVLGFWEYLKSGLPLTILTTLLALALLG